MLKARQNLNFIGSMEDNRIFNPIKNLLFPAQTSFKTVMTSRHLPNYLKIETLTTSTCKIPAYTHEWHSIIKRNPTLRFISNTFTLKENNMREMSPPYKRLLPKKRKTLFPSLYSRSDFVLKSHEPFFPFVRFRYRNKKV